MYPGSFAGDLFSEQTLVNIRQHALESGCFVVNATAWLDADQQAQIAALNEDNRAANMRTVHLNAAYFPAVELLSALVTVEILAVGGIEAIQGHTKTGVVFAFVAAPRMANAPSVGSVAGRPAPPPAAAAVVDVVAPPPGGAT